MIEVKTQAGRMKKIDYFVTLTDWLTEHVDEGNWNFVVTNGNMFDPELTFTFVNEQDAILFRLRFGI